MHSRDPKKLGLTPVHQVRPEVRNLALFLSFCSIIAAIVFFSVLESETVTASSYPVSEDKDQDDVPNWIDIDDDNDGIPDVDECERSQTSTFVNSGTYMVPGSDGVVFDISALDNSFNMNINGTQLVPSEIQFHQGSVTGSMSLARFASDNSPYGQNGIANVWSVNWANANPNLIQLRLTISADGGVSLEGIRSVGSPLEEMILDPAHPQFNAISWNASGTNTVVISQVKSGPTFIYAKSYSSCGDFDGDGIPNHWDLDSDGDGVSDLLEGGGTDSDGDGQVAYSTPGDPTSMTDSDGDGLLDALDNIDSGSGAGEQASGSPLPLLNTDGLGKENFLDIDSDDDGIVDIVEAQSTLGALSPSGSDTDEDGIDDVFDIDCQPCGAITGANIDPIDTGHDPSPDYIDLDSDGDGIPDSIEGHDTNGDGVVDGSDSPVANTGLPGGTTDSDEDGLLDGFDNIIDPSTFDPTNGGLTANAYPDFQGVTSERDWREKSTLPVEWVSFEVEPNGTDALLRWSTAVETNSDYYQVERSQDGQLFTELGRINAAGTTTTLSSYQYLDRAVGNLSGRVVLYRLRQVDMNGSVDFSRTVELELGESPSHLTLSAFPNPVRDVLTLRMESEGPVSVTIASAAGQIVFESALPAANSLQEISVPVAGWSSGMYSVVVTGSNARRSQQIVVN